MTSAPDPLHKGSPAPGERPDSSARFPESSVPYIFLAISILSVAGIAVSLVSLQRHYAKSATSYCDFGEKFSCDIVNRSEQSELIGIPVAAIGVVGYGALLVLSTFYRARPETPFRLLLAAAVGLLFALRLTYVEGYVLMTWCVLCLTSQGLIFSITVLAAAAKLRATQSS